MVLQDESPGFGRGSLAVGTQQADSSAAHVAVHEVLNADIVATTKCFPVGTAVPSGDVGMPVLVAIIYIRSAMVSVVFAGSFNTIVEAATLNFLILRRRRFPWLLRAISIVVSRRRWSLGNEGSRDERQRRYCHNSQ